MKNKDENGLLPCPFCKSGETRIDEQSFWTGMRSQVLSVSVRHWCPKNPLQSYVEVKAKTREEAVKTWNTRPQQSQSGDVQLALDALDRMYNDALASQDGYGTSHDDFETIRDALTAQPDVNAELLDDTGLFCIINILEKAKVCAQNIIYDLPMGHNSGQQAIYARNYIHKAIYALQTATMQESVNAELLEALKEAVRLWEQHDPIHEYHINEWKKAIDRAALTAQQDVNQELLDALKSVLSHVENEDVKRVSDQCTICYSYRKMIRDAIARAEK